MGVKSTSLAIGLAFAVVVNDYAVARTTTGFSAFRVEFQSTGQYPTDPYTCLFETYGAVVNNCTYPVSLDFDLPIENS